MTFDSARTRHAVNAKRKSQSLARTMAHYNLEIEAAEGNEQAIRLLSQCLCEKCSKKRGHK